MTILKDLGFKQYGTFSQNWLWRHLYIVLTKAPEGTNLHGKSKIIKNLNTNFTGDKRETILFQGSFAFDNDDFANKLLTNVGIIERITGNSLVELKDTNHNQVLTDLGFTEISYNTWTKNIFLISLRPPRFENDRGKCIILKKPNIKKLINSDRPANVVYKGRYFFDDNVFTQILLEKIGFYHFDSGKKNKTYEFTRETVADTALYIDKEFLNF